MPMFKTSLKMFNDNKLFGQGPKSYRYSCDKEKFITYFPGSKKVDNTRIKATRNTGKKRDSMVILKFFVREGDIIEKGDKILTYQIYRVTMTSQFFSPIKKVKLIKL